MESYAIKNLTFTYPNRSKPALDNLSFTVGQGEFIVLTGPTGCGKTTLLRHLKPALTPYGDKDGEICFEGRPVGGLELREQSAKIGFVMQNADNQIVTDRVWHELAFGLENLGLDAPAIRLRVAEMASFFGIQDWFHRSVAELSGGQRQLLNLAAVMAMQPSALILDEPTGQLDPIAAVEFLAVVGRINRELGTTVILTEHRLEEVFPLADRVIVMADGRLICDADPQAIGGQLKTRDYGMFSALPVPMRVWTAVDCADPCPVTVRDGRDWLSRRDIDRKKPPAPPPRDDSASPSIELDGVWFRYEKDAPDIIKGLSFKAYPGEITAILGGNGTGKTTALSLISRLNRPYRGRIRFNGQEVERIADDRLFRGILGVLPQNPQALFVGKTVGDDLREALGDIDSGNEAGPRLRAISSLCRLDGLLESHPYDLSGGEQQRAALAKVLLTEPDILLLDEPTKGLDAGFKQVFAGILRKLTAKGVTVVMVSHDVEFCAEYADRCALFFDGDIVSTAEPRAFFSGNSFYTSSANRMARHILPTAITAGDIIAALQGDPPVLPPPEREAGSPPDRRPEPRLVSSAAYDRPKLSKRTVAAVAMILFAIPFTIYLGLRFPFDRRYYVISTLVILETMLPFALVFEGRKPQARELIVIALLCATGIAGRAAFFMLPQFKPVTAIIIISGAAFGGEAGFLVGAMTAFTSNMFFGQGPWTPWQMFCFGIIGFLAGILFQRGPLRRSRAALCVYGGAATFLIYGGIMDTSNVLIYQANPAKEMFLLTALQGLPFNLIHAASTVIFLLLIARPMLEKLERIKTKYRLIE